MKRFVYIMLLFIATWMVVSCNTTKAGKTTLIQTKQPAGNTINILINDSGTKMNRIMDGIHQSAGVTGMQVKTNDNFLNPDREIRKFIKYIPYKQINEIRNVLCAIPEVKLITISKN